MNPAPTRAAAPPKARPDPGPLGVYACPYCHEEHARPSYLALHIGRVHPEQMDREEAAAAEAAHADEEAVLAHLRKHVKSGLAVVPVFLFFVLTLSLLAQIERNVGFAIMLFPAFIAFSVLVYGMMFSRLTLKENEQEG